jgi:transposase-like protein
MENLNRQIKRRTNQISLFANTDSALRLISAIASEISDDWEGGRCYLDMSAKKP